MLLGMGQPAGTYTGNGTTQSIDIGRKPIKVRILNWTQDGSEEVLKLEGMEDSTCQLNKNNKGKILTGGITFTATGFTIGDSKYVNRNGETYIWEAW